MRSIEVYPNLFGIFNYIPFGEKPKILLEAWYKLFTIQHAQPEDSNELFQKHLEDLKELAEYKESLENASTEIVVLNSNQEKEKPLQDFDIRQLIREECCIEVSEEQKKIMEDTILDALNSKCFSINSQCLDKKKHEVKNVIEQPAEHGTHIVKSLQNFRVIHKSSISLKNTCQISLVHAVAPILSTQEPKYSTSIGYEHPNATLDTEIDEKIKSGIEELVPILSENVVTSEDKKECDVPVCENSPICDDHSDILSDSNNDDISKEENVVYLEEEEIDLEDISLIQDVVLCEKLLSINRLIANIESLNDNPTLDCVLYSSISIPTSEESDNSLSDNFSLEFETFCDHTEETRSDNSIPPGVENFGDDSEGDIRFLNALLIDDSIPFPNNESFESDFHNPSFPRPPLEPPDAEFNFKPDSGEEILVVMNDKLECLDTLRVVVEL
uniref:Reverse transcriptase domain-containing protein n=1 Tax=Tanacetum cinerariifolium TaxID=118510 RepID=A0A6L2JI34_TANCI|nr:hypothetical protein [Tanacetum cinerariifolium]